jgi:hypothetical protein
MAESPECPLQLCVSKDVDEYLEIRKCNVYPPKYHSAAGVSRIVVIATESEEIFGRTANCKFI